MAVFLICLLGILPSAITKPHSRNDPTTPLSLSYLNPSHWISTLHSTYTPTELVYSREGTRTPVICEFKEIYVDSIRIYLIPQPSKLKEAIEDLFTCCLNTNSTTEEFMLPRSDQCRGSVSFHACRCFHNWRYVPSVVSPQVISSVQKNLSNVSWLMNHWSFIHHPDHFAMRLLELHGVLYNLEHGTLSWSSSLPQQEISQLVSMDYPGYHRTDYESMVLALLETMARRKIPFHFLHSEETFRDGFSKRFPRYLHPFEIVAPLCAAGAKGEWQPPTKHKNHPIPPLPPSDITTLPIHLPLAHFCQAFLRSNGTGQTRGWSPFPKVYYLEHALLPRVYKNNIPPPFVSSAKGLHLSLNSLISQNFSTTMAEDHGSLRCLSPPPPSSQSATPLSRFPQVALLLRAEGKGLRRFVNVQEMVLSIRKITGQEFISLLFISSKTPGLVQAARFCQFHILVTPHTSQLTNLVFAPPNVSVIEIQNEGLQEETFQNLSLKMGLHYQLLKTSPSPPPSSSLLLSSVLSSPLPQR
jgi:hypothetical protein